MQTFKRCLCGIKLYSVYFCSALIEMTLCRDSMQIRTNKNILQLWFCIARLLWKLPAPGSASTNKELLVKGWENSKVDEMFSCIFAKIELPLNKVNTIDLLQRRYYFDSINNVFYRCDICQIFTSTGCARCMKLC